MINRHINNVFKEGECDKESNVHFLHIPNSDKPVMYYSLDVIISVGYRVKSLNGTKFRKWANSVLKQYLLKGPAVIARLAFVCHLATLSSRAQSSPLSSRLSAAHGEIPFVISSEVERSQNPFTTHSNPSSPTLSQITPPVATTPTRNRQISWNQSKITVSLQQN